MRNIILAVCFIVISSCATHKFVFLGDGPDRPMNDIEPDYIIHNNFWWAGLAQTREVDIVHRCDRGDNTVVIETYQSFSNILLSALTLSIYKPTTTNIYCRY